MTGPRNRGLPRVIILILLAAFTAAYPAHARDWTKEEKATALNLAAAYNHWGYHRENAATIGALSAFGLMGYMELGDLVSDYDHMKFLAALKFSGFSWARKGPWRYFECQLGYFARGYPHDPVRERNLYIGLGINLSEVFSALSMRTLSTVFTYYQLPYTYLSHDRNLNC